MEMAPYEGVSESTHKGKKGHPPKRGQVKARIIGSLVRSVLTMASKRSGREGRGQREGEEYSTSTMSPSSGYSSEAPSTFTPMSNLRAAAAGAPTFFLSSTNSLDGFVVEMPKKVLCRYPALEPAFRGRD